MIPIVTSFPCCCGCCAACTECSDDFEGSGALGEASCGLQWQQDGTLPIWEQIAGTASFGSQGTANGSAATRWAWLEQGGVDVAVSWTYASASSTVRSTTSGVLHASDVTSPLTAGIVAPVIFNNAVILVDGVVVSNQAAGGTPAVGDVGTLSVRGDGAEVRFEISGSITYDSGWVDITAQNLTITGLHGMAGPDNQAAQINRNLISEWSIVCLDTAEVTADGPGPPAEFGLVEMLEASNGDGYIWSAEPNASVRAATGMVPDGSTNGVQGVTLVTDATPGAGTTDGPAGVTPLTWASGRIDINARDVTAKFTGDSFGDELRISHNGTNYLAADITNGTTVTLQLTAATIATATGVYAATDDLWISRQGPFVRVWAGGVPGVDAPDIAVTLTPAQVGLASGDNIGVTGSPTDLEIRTVAPQTDFAVAPSSDTGLFDLELTATSGTGDEGPWFRAADTSNGLVLDRDGTDLNLNLEVAGVPTTLATAAGIAAGDRQIRGIAAEDWVFVWVDSLLAIAHQISTANMDIVGSWSGVLDGDATVDILSHAPRMGVWPELSGTNAHAVQTTDGSTGAHLSGEALVLPGVAGNYAATSDKAALDITGDITLVFDGTPDDYTPAAVQAFLGKYTTTGDQRSFYFRLDPAGTLAVVTTSTGAAPATTVTSSVAASTTATAFAVSIDVDNGAANSDFTFYQRVSGTWAQLGTVQNGGSVISIFSGTAVLEVGSVTEGTFLLFQGEVRGARVYSGLHNPVTDLGGTLVASPDFTAPGYEAESFTDAQGNVWDINSTVDDRRPIYLPDVTVTGLATAWFDSAAAMTAPNGTLTQPFTVAMAGGVNNESVDQYLAGFGTAVTRGLYFDSAASGRWALNAGTALEAGTDTADIGMKVLRAVPNGGSSYITQTGEVVSAGDAGANAATANQITFGAAWSGAAYASPLQLGQIGQVLAFEWETGGTVARAIDVDHARWNGAVIPDPVDPS